GAANDKEQNLRQRMRDTPSLPRILDDGKMVQQQPKARFLRQDVNGKAHGGGSESTPLHGIRIPATPKPPLTRVQSPGVISAALIFSKISVIRRGPGLTRLAKRR